MARRIFVALTHDPVILFGFLWGATAALSTWLWLQSGEFYWVIGVLYAICGASLLAVVHSYIANFYEDKPKRARVRRISFLIMLAILSSLMSCPIFIIKNNVYESGRYGYRDDEYMYLKTRYIGLSYGGAEGKVIMGVGNLFDLYRFWESLLLGRNIRWYGVDPKLLSGEKELSELGNLGTISNAQFEVVYSYSFNAENLPKLRAGNKDFDQCFKEWNDGLQAILDRFVLKAGSDGNINLRSLEKEFGGASGEFYMIHSVKAKIKLPDNTWVE